MRSDENPEELSAQLLSEPPQKQNAAEADRPSPGESREDDGERALLQRFLLSFRTMDFHLRFLTGIVLAEVIAAVIFIGTKNSFLSTLHIDVGEGATLTIPSITFYVVALTVLLALYLLTHGLVEATLKGCLFFLGVLLAFYSAYVGLVVPVYALVFAPLLFKIVANCAFAVSFGQLYRDHYSPERQSKLYLWGGLLIVISPGLIFIFRNQGDFLFYLELLWFPLPVIYLLAGVDWAEILDAVAQSLLMPSIGKASSVWLAVAGAVLCSGFAVTMILFDAAVWKFLPAMVGALLYIAIVVWATGVSESWGMHFSWASMVILMAVFFLFDIAGKGFSQGKIPPSFWPACFSVLAAFVLFAFTRMGKFARLWPTLLFGTILGTFWAVALSRGQTSDSAVISGPMFGIAAASLLGITGALWLSRKGYDVCKALFYTILLNVGCIALYTLAFGVYVRTSKISDQKQVVEAVVVFAAILWDIFISGHSITNTGGKMFSRRSRAYLFFGYILIVTATVVFWDSAVITHGGSVNQIDLNDLVHVAMKPEMYVTSGIVSVGPPMLLALFLLRVTKWLPRRTNSPEIAQRG